MLYKIISIVLGYLLGGIPVGLIIGKIIKGIDVREYGSKNMGAANVARLVNKKAGVMTMIGDMLKGGIATLLGRILIWSDLFNNNGLLNDPGVFLAIIGLAAIIGHSYPIYIGFHGGKSGSVSAGILLGINPIAFIIMFGSWVIILIITKYTSLSNLIIAWLMPLLLWCFSGPKFFMNNNWLAGGIGFIMLIVVYWRHKENIKRLVKGEERKFGQKEKIKDENGIKNN